MKKYFIIAAAALVAMCACTKNEVNTLPDQEINFQVANYLNQTKANVAFTGDSFGVYAWYTSDAGTTAETDQPFMVNETVVPALPGWKVEGKTYFWPKTGDIDFFAYAPKASTPWATRNMTSGKLEGSFTSADGTEDYMYSSMAMNYTENDPLYKVTPGDAEGTLVSDGVPVLFHHALSKVTVNFKANPLELTETVDNETKTVAKWVVTVNEAHFVDVVKGGTLALSLNTTPTSGVVDWALPTPAAIWTPGTDKIELQAADAQTLTTSFVAPKLSEYTVLPQALSTVGFYIDYTIEAYNDFSEGAKPYSVETIQKTFDLTGTDGIFADIENWEMNKKYIYNVTIAPSTSEILFDPAVVEWEDGGSASQTFPIVEE